MGDLGPDPFLAEHDRRSDERAANICRKIDSLEEKIMEIEGEEIHGDQGRDEHHHHYGEREMGQNLDIMSALSGRGDSGGFGGFGGGALLGVLLGRLLLNNGTDGLGGGAGSGSVNQITLDTVLSKLGDIQGAIPLATANTENVILQQTNAIQNIATQAQLANQAGFSTVKDAVTNTGTALLISQNAGFDRVLAAITDQNISNLERQLTVAELRASEDRVTARSREVEVNVSQVVTQAQAQQQQQAQLQALFSQFANIANDLQTIKQGQVIFNSGTMAASGTQAAANTRVA